MTGTYEIRYGLPSPWPSDDDKSRYQHLALVHAVVFSFLAFVLGASIVRTILTNPGNIPEEKEWDM